MHETPSESDCGARWTEYIGDRSSADRQHPGEDRRRTGRCDARSGRHDQQSCARRRLDDWNDRRWRHLPLPVARAWHLPGETRARRIPDHRPRRHRRARRPDDAD